ncbi:MAG: hypothetical protein A3C49_02290 [Candidatus Doudnabacteria bacterium RIFCSPHIGHO2_02_FULL_42_25]|uniref:Phosphatidic acid phosphatase type 2/haloperoxidase domain-containing protein n=1 Tax=Candidatus Doudnabacteria bacterium RIFCSPHIGHO2_01_FULL_41_86 TaxID=1817821 RepID=A0A1F5N9D4_9BACT|nr:MAG: hypothetical protein A2717_01885 [Candidatus Doudnabacteria bacterium RIFCSPHIGHO2_01_FULL_41_86]OGE74978.1 MAG: hypothetical protein A3K07_04365 [Candidatus Doudnabacteria bacterium RIFCSPHIGHO2_01_43_10]OGE85315.1 MAG: hypothetical protein A3E28_01455 [Candidatus Doudnabacteria bacterium RIFCSPHIGHO2_12_FULL_42_22]OGE86853.1 MAG: hypothetical protein A3C49_02290 [Candidatus Doudnabacteria bacterium RIFCSPHIGHO2_02_FULL_42_25]OGE92452.1 MAG: hypothetical protein A2895_02445 [Candidatus
MDYAIFEAINGLAGKSSFLDGFGIFLATVLIFIFLGFIGGLLANKQWNLRKRVYIAFISALISRVILVEIIKRLIDRPRPFEVLDVHQLLVDEGSGKSFPSGHTVIFFSIAFAFWGTRWFWPMFIIATLGSIVRIFVGVHYPSDILVGAIIGAAVSLVLLKLHKIKFQQK